MHKRNESGFHFVPLLIIVAVIGLIGLVAWRVISTIQDKKNDFQASFNGNCKNGDVAFTSPPMRMEDLGYIRPLGAMLDGHVTPTDHVYVTPIKQDVPDNTYPVLMPADGTVVEVSRMPDQYVGDRQGVQLPQEDHRMVVSFSCRYSAVFIHIHKLSDAVAAAVGTLKPNESKSVSVDLKAGDTYGYIGGSSFDWTPVDTQSRLSGYITPDLYKSESWKIHTVSPYDLYTGDLKKQLEAKSTRTIPPIGGKIDYDQPGKLVGNWFREGTNGYAGGQQQGDGGGRYWDGHLAVVPDYINPSYTIVSIGNWTGNAKQFLVKGDVDPSKIGSGTPVKYELTQFSYAGPNNQPVQNSGAQNMHPVAIGGTEGTIMFEVQSGEKLKVEKFPGKTADQVGEFTSAAQTYER
ncbi:MAG TPA: hypothetical protein VJM32_01565 [Candidatus Saccharimonadales bacterium]|nr:hypothetical protein [Candidatus Saccharimonadales bacterium]